MNNYSISQVAKIVDLPPKTIRFYEESGILSPAHRAENGYRMYDQTAIDELTLIKYARDLGVPLSEMKKLMTGCENNSCEHTQAQLTSSIDDYIINLTKKIEEFTVLKNKLQQLKENITFNKDTCSGDQYCCNILSQLAQLK